jgi:hypothetical protein
VMTGLGTTHLDKYSFKHLVAGQLPASEWIMRPAPHGSHKRLTFVISPDRPDSAPGQDCKESLKLITRVHVWMLESILSFPGVNMFDGYARSMFAAVRRGINEFLDSPPVPIRPALQAKLDFVDTDLLRLSNMNMRYMQALELIRWPESKPETRVAINVYEFAMAFHGWMRQIHIHSAFYNYVAQVASSVPRRAGSDNGAEMADAMAAGGPVRSPVLDLTGTEKHMHVVMKAVRAKASFSSHDVNLAVKNLKDVRNGSDSTHACVQKVLDALTGGGLVRETTDEAKKRPGRKVRQFKRCSWQEVAANAASNALRARLHLARDDFE